VYSIVSSIIAELYLCFPLWCALQSRLQKFFGANSNAAHLP
jgi:hypothetical protein